MSIKKIKDFIKICCEICKVKKATYFYMPGKNDGQNFYCANCVPRGCSCEWNYVSKDAYGPEPLDADLLPQGIEGKDWKWIERPGDEDHDEIKKGEIWVDIDEEGREYSCCEFMWRKEGFNKE